MWESNKKIGSIISGYSIHDGAFSNKFFLIGSI